MQKRYGFTLVELLIAVTVIVILAGMTAFFVGDWRERSADTQVRSTIKSAQAALDNYRNYNNNYPSTLNEVYSGSSDVSLKYILRTSDSTYCLSALSESVDSVGVYIDSRVSESIKDTTTACSS